MYATPTRPLTQDELDLICGIWGNKGSDDPTGLWMELWDGGDVDEHAEQRDAIIAIANECGLEAGVRDGILRLQHTQQTYDECGLY